MPPSSDQDSTNTSSSSSQPNKQSQKSALTGVQIPAKNGRKNGTAKDHGGGSVLAAVTKNKISSQKSSGQSTQTQSPELRPIGSPLNGNNVSSPLLDALSSANLDRSQPQNTSEWARNVPAYSSSPNNLINLGESPPTFSYEDRLANFGWTTREQRGIPSGHPSSASPPMTGRRRPLSYQLDANYPSNVDDHRSPVSSYAAHVRRASMYSQHSRYPQNPPLPHQVQPHFYGAPDANLMLSPPASGLVPGENGYYCGFDVLSKENVVVAGYEGGIKVYAVSKRGLTKISSIEGLRGGVYDAKILPWTAEGMGAHHFPLIALVVHGPVWSMSEGSSNEDVLPSEGTPATQNGTVRGSPQIPSYNNEDIEYYQTTVEVYSLSGSKPHIATLLSVPKTSLPIPTTSPAFRAPPPVGSLTIRADSGSVVVASGTTGETWIFHQGDLDSDSPDKFKCIAKVWTTVQHGVTVDTGAINGLTEGDWQSNDQPAVRKQYKASILALQGRWLAYCPPTPSSQISLRAVVPYINSSTRIPGLNAHAPPQLPAINCGVETPGGESMMKQIVQIGTQKFIEAGNFLAQQGVQAWNNYRSKPSPNQPAAGSMMYQPHGNMVQQFPPTHGLPTPAPLVTKDPGLISILDLESLSQHTSSHASSLHPLATFKVPHGCSFLSFAPSGLALFTASSKGDVQCVWDLMRIQYAKSSFLKVALQGTSLHGPHVRQIAQFSRMTIARIVDVVWTSPHGERAAMVTEPGTIHILDLPASAFTWPPPRRRTPIQKHDDTTNDVASTHLTASSVASSAVSSLWTAARPLVSRRRRSSGGISARTVTAQAGHGTHALAAGISRSVGAATGKMNEMRKSSGTKLHLPRSSTVPSRACVLLLNGKRNDSVIALGGGIVRIYTIKNRRADRPADKQRPSIKMSVEFRIPSLPDFKFAPELVRDLQQASDLELTERDIEETRWKARHSPPPGTITHGTESSIPQAEIESNAPYQPFHTDRRVGLHIFSSEEVLPASPSVSVLLAPNQATLGSRPVLGSRFKGAWVFGGPIRCTKLDVGPVHNPEDDFEDSVNHRTLPSSAIERVLRVSDNAEDTEQIVITTRRRKGATRLGVEDSGNADEEGFFEDDCEVLDFASQRV